MNWQSPLVKGIVKRALEEDIWTGDITTLSIVPAEERATGHIWSKADGVVAGLPIAELVFKNLDPELEFTYLVEEGQVVTAGTVLAKISGPAQSLLQGERVALNFLQRLSGIATRTSRLTEVIKFYNCEVVDTRKTTPGLRVLEKYAVRMGGGRNHRFGLYDAVLIKDNHIVVAGGVREAVTAVRRNLGHTVKIEVEVKSMDQLTEALEARVDIIMLDNMSPDEMREAVKVIDGRALTEASGRITEESIVEVAKAGVDYISIGVLTHSVQSLDISLDISTKGEGEQDNH